MVPATRVPKNWSSFLRVDANKTELFQLLAEQAVTLSMDEGKELYTTHDQHVLTSADRVEMTQLEPCTHEEADTRIFLHVYDAYQSGHRRILIRTCDTDVVVLAISVVSALPGCDLWIAYGTGKNMRYVSASMIALRIGRDKASALPLFHALTGCDTVSFFAGRGKKTAFALWNVFPQLTNVLLTLMSTPATVDQESFAVIERFVVLLYDRTSSLVDVNEARKDLFSRKSRTLDNIPPSSAALLQHVQRAVYQAGHIWSQLAASDPVIPSPSE